MPKKTEAISDSDAVRALQPGRVYRLSRDVQNPKPDRRSSGRAYDWPDHVLIKEGTLFCVRDTWRYYADDVIIGSAIQKTHETEPWRWYEIENFSGRGGIQKGITPHWYEHAFPEKKYDPAKDLFALVAAALAPARRTLDVFLWEHDEGSAGTSDVLNALLRHGRISWGMIEDGIALHRADGADLPEDTYPPLPVAPPRFDLTSQVCSKCGYTLQSHMEPCR